MLARLAARQLRSHPWQLGLAILGIALGVAVAVSIDLANGSALRAFGLATEAVSGRATHQILGGPSGLPDDLYRRLRVDVGARRTAPIVEGDVALWGPWRAQSSPPRHRSVRRQRLSGPISPAAIAAGRAPAMRSPGRPISSDRAGRR